MTDLATLYDANVRMCMYLWGRVDDLTENYHAEGGLVIIASSLDRARELLRATRGTPDACSAYTTEPDKVHELAGGGPESVNIFPDAGCC